MRSVFSRLSVDVSSRHYSHVSNVAAQPIKALLFYDGYPKWAANNNIDTHEEVAAEPPFLLGVWWLELKRVLDACHRPNRQAILGRSIFCLRAAAKSAKQRALGWIPLEFAKANSGNDALQGYGLTSKLTKAT